MSFETFKVFIEIEVKEDEFESTVTSFRHTRSNDELNFGIKGMLLCDVEGHRGDRIEFPKEVGCYKMMGEYDDSSEVIVDIWDVEKI